MKQKQRTANKGFAAMLAESLSNQHFTVIKLSFHLTNISGQKNDAVRLSNTEQLDLHFIGELIYVQTPTRSDYNPM